MASTKNYDICLESDLPLVQQQGLNTNKNTFLGGTLETTGVATFDASATVSGAITAQGGAAMAATAAQAIAISTTSTFGIYYGNGLPTAIAASAATGSLYINYGGTGVASRLFVNTSGGTGWTAVTTVA